MYGGKEEARGGWEGGNKGREGGRGGEGEGGREAMMEGGNEGGREVREGEGAREEANMLCRERASVEEEMVEGGKIDEGNERGRGGTAHGRRVGKRGERK